MEYDLKDIVKEFVAFLVKKQGINLPYKIDLVYKRTPEFKTHAYYNPDSKKICVCVQGRQTADILRSIAHEMIHHKQNQDNKLTKNVKDIGGPIEDEANARAGSLVKKFGYDFPDFNIYSS